MATEDTLRLFFALPCPPAQTEAICAWRDRQTFSGRAVPAENLHLTLAFLGAQPAERLPALCQLADELSCERFELCLDQLITLGERFVCLAPGAAPPQLLQLAAQLAERLHALGIVLDSRPYRPHLTLLREARHPAHGPVPAFGWQVREFALYLSQTTAHGVRYQALRRWSLPLLPVQGAPT